MKEEESVSTGERAEETDGLPLAKKIETLSEKGQQALSAHHPERSEERRRRRPRGKERGTPGWRVGLLCPGQ